MKIYEHNIETNQAEVRDMTAAEIAQFNLDQEEAELAKEAQARAEAAKLAAQNKLAALGLTVEDLRALGL